MDSSEARERADRWVKHLQKAFMRPAMETPDPEANVFQVPATISRVKPEAYTPKLISLGPYHHLRPDLRTPDPYKIHLAKLFLTPSQIHQFQALMIDELMDYTVTIRNCYHGYLDLEDEHLVWIIATDSLFLLQFLKTCEYLEKKNEGTVRDIMMLENQIPLILLKKIWTILDSGPESELVSMLASMCKKVSPLSLIDESLYLTCALGDRMHLLDMMYQLIVANCKQNQMPKAFAKVPPFSQLSTKTKFLPCKGIRDINFNQEKFVLCLPTLNLDVNSEVVLRNLVAYETLSEKPTLEMSGYVYLMSEIIRSSKNVKMLREAGIVTSDGSINDDKIAQFFNGFNKSNN